MPSWPFSIAHWRRLLPSRLLPLLRWRFFLFGLVGASGTVINVLVLYAAQELLLMQIADFHDRLNYSIALAISCATVSNFYWNRRLTWHDRRHDHPRPVLVLFLKYVLAAALAISVQSLLTKWLSSHMHYIAANLVGIALASVCSFVANDKLTFRRRPPTATAKPTPTPPAAPQAAAPMSMHKLHAPNAPNAPSVPSAPKLTHDAQP